MTMQMQEMSSDAPRGVKRPHNDDLGNAQRLAKRFHLLNLGEYNHALCACPLLTFKLGSQHNGMLWAPPCSQAHPDTRQRAQPPTKLMQATSDFMNVDDTKHRVYIHDLDAELAGLSEHDEEQERVMFLPDIERRLNSVPHSVLAREKTQAPEQQQMVLYSVPRSLSVPAEQDSVRKAIVEARARTREQQQKGDVEPQLQSAQPNSDYYPARDFNNTAASPIAEDHNAMDLG